MASGFDDEELSMSLSSSHPDRRPQRPAPRRPPQGQERVTNKVPTDKRTAQRIGLYDVKKTLGEGSFGKVKLATHQVTKQEVALKIISRKKLISRDMAGRVEREIQYLQLLRHPHIIKLYVGPLRHGKGELTVAGTPSLLPHRRSLWYLNTQAESFLTTWLSMDE